MHTLNFLTCLNKNILQLFFKRKGTNFLKARRRRHCPPVQGEMKLKITQANFHCANKANGQKDNLRMDSFSRWKVLRRRKLSFIIQPSTLPAQDFLLHVSRVILCTSAGFDDPRVSLDTGSTDQLYSFQSHFECDLLSAFPYEQKLSFFLQIWTKKTQYGK